MRRKIDNQIKNKFLTGISLVCILVMLLCYVTTITSIPDSIILIQGEKISIANLWGLKIDIKNDEYATLEASTLLNENSLNASIVGKANLEVSLFGKVPVKDVAVNVIAKTKVIPVGNSIGIKLYTSGVLVVGMTEVSGSKPYQNSGIKEGDMIVEIDDRMVTCTADLIQCVNKSKGDNLKIKYTREGAIYTTNMTPIKTSDIEYKLGLWVRDGTIGVGMLSFYEPSTGSFAALGHGIVDIDTEKLLTISSGDVLNTSVVSIKKGEKGKPGELRGALENNTVVGTINKNTSFGVFGKIKDATALGIDRSKEYEIALRDEVKEGDAKILCTLKDNVIEEFDIKIQTIYKNNNYDNKSIVIRVTDERLLEQTGGIIQGMSGSPIIQDGKLIGVVTHVLVNDPTMGYALFADLMLKKMRE